MSLMMNDIRYFETVSSTLNMTRASEILGITQPTLSYAIKRLEKELGGALLIRLKNGVQLTKLGEEFTKQGQVVLLEWEQAKKLARNQGVELSGLYTLGLHPSVAHYSLKHFLPALNTHYPNLEFSFKFGLSREITEQVVSWKIDFGLVINPKPHLDLVISHLCDDRFTLFDSFKSFKGQENKTLIFDPNLLQTQEILKNLDKKFLGFKKIEIANLEIIAELCSLGLGVGILPEKVAKSYQNLKALDDVPFYTDKLCLVYRIEKKNNQASRVIIDKILEAKNYF